MWEYRSQSSEADRAFSLTMMTLLTEEGCVFCMACQQFSHIAAHDLWTDPWKVGGVEKVVDKTYERHRSHMNSASLIDTMRDAYVYDSSIAQRGEFVAEISETRSRPDDMSLTAANLRRVLRGELHRSFEHSVREARRLLNVV